MSGNSARWTARQTAAASAASAGPMQLEPAPVSSPRGVRKRKPVESVPEEEPYEEFPDDPERATKFIIKRVTVAIGDIEGAEGRGVSYPAGSPAEGGRVPDRACRDRAEPAHPGGPPGGVLPG